MNIVPDLWRFGIRLMVLKRVQIGKQGEQILTTQQNEQSDQLVQHKLTYIGSSWD